MLTLFTGAPGAGKTALMVDELARLFKGRPIFAHGLEGLTIPHTDLSLEDVQKWHEIVPEGGVLVIDEAQRVWRPRGPGQKVPDHVAELETHRHRGIDVLITTQGPHLIDKNVRALVGRHVHLRDVGVLGRRLYEWSECSENLAWRSATISKAYKLPKRAFALYKSSSLHVKPVRTFPLMLAVAAASVVGLGVVGWMAWGIVFDRGPASSGGAASAQSGASKGSQSVGSRAPRLAPHSAQSLVIEASPRLDSRPETAPRFDALRVVVRMPRIMGGFCAADLGCRCYIQDGLRAPISAAACAEWIRDPQFDPYYLPSPPLADGGGSARFQPSHTTPREPPTSTPSPGLEALGL
jgi:zona occludens toxin